MKKLLVVLLFSVSLFGCAGVKMAPIAPEEIKPVAEDMSRVEFMRSSFVGGAVAASIYDVTDGEPEFIGVLNNGKRITADVEPGKRTFMVVSEAADYMAAELKPGLTYFSVVTPRIGVWKARFSMWPVRNGGEGEFTFASDQFDELMSDTQLVKNTPKSLEWYKNNSASIAKKHNAYWPKWQLKEPQDLAERTLNIDDGVKR
ncbi:hypothetical protein MIB92_18130 [Aestuariirhabdus sp. Z084]|uniref:hypothetical protein n=1 Tax=Aestuariirhabdus haliotis TaxID=2918751 RepID=UPI00201B45D7|nr:hypothetical protein [Aestuariirhabdus haliotis]MCL6417584.1 hypothetical protein [Aestuariirhabdus haliotis]MCL6421512.1 hypothetical protein [Aestuariirhabdus haliotis]